MIIDLFIASVILWLAWIVFANTRHYIGKDYAPPIQAIAHLFSVIFLVLDVAFNFTYATVLFMQLPSFKRPTLTQRMKRILRDEPINWRWKLADFVCRRMVEPWDFNHCGLRE